jgi:hypothetical protein
MGIRPVGHERLHLTATALSAVPMLEDIVQRVHSDFAESDRPWVVDALELYKGAEPDRVRRCILHLAGGALEKVSHFVEAANADQRDVIYWAEYDRNDRRVRDFSKAFA